MIQLASTSEAAAQPPEARKAHQQLQFSRLGDVVVVQLPEDLYDLLAIVSTEEELSRFVEHSKPKRLVISFDRVRSCGSQAVGDLIKLAKRIRGYGGEVKLCSMSGRVREVFDLCRLIGPLFEVYRSTSEAAESLSN